MPSIRTALAIIAFFAAGLAWAGQVYRYVDEQGNTVIGSTLPAEAARRGYAILDGNGRVVKEVPPAPTQEELAEKARQERERKALEEAERQQREADRQLLRLYSHPNDAAGALNRKLEQMRSILQLKKGNIASARSQIQQAQSRAADLERAGQKVPQQILDRIDRLEADIQQTQREIELHEEELKHIIRDFKARIDRLEALTGEKRTVPLQLSAPDKKPSSTDP